jgi:Ca2+-transporting ATPase
MEDAQDREGKARAWHTVAAGELAAELGSGPHGLSVAEAKARLDEHGPNAIEEVPPPGALSILIHQFRSPVIYILVVATVVTLFLEEFVDAGVIAAVLMLNAIIGFTQERRAEASVRALMQLVSPRARVVREGREWEIESRELVRGDLVLLESGVRVPADLRLESVNNLRVDESLLTGESVSIGKQEEPLEDASLLLADRRNMAYAGSIVTTGRARGLVVATAMGTELGTIARHMRSQKVPETPLQRRMAQFARVVGIAVGLSSAAAFILGVLLGESVSQMFVVAVALAVAAIPEGLPVAFTITLALGVRRMARRNAIIRRLAAVETLGSTTVIGSDKTGTLTENRMTVREVWTAGRAFRLEGDSITPIDGGHDIAAVAEHRPLYLTLLAAVLSNEAEFYREAGGFDSHGDPTEAALLIAAARLGIEPEEARHAYRSEIELPFESERQYSASVRRHEGRRLVFLKGAPERLLGMSSTEQTDEGEVPCDRTRVQDAVHLMAGRGLRVLAMAYRQIEEDGFDPTKPDRLVFLGLQGLVDPPRAGVRDAIAGCHGAGIRVVMITGDHADTASAIARELGIARDQDEVVTGLDLERWDDAELEQRVGKTSVYARAAPEHKLRIVQALQRQGEVVAITGDGVNDAPALRAADIGVAMGKSGTDVAREAADMVLADDNFVSIEAAVEEGRITFDNVRKVTFFLISTGAADILTILASVILNWPLPMVAAQLLWVNLVTNGLQDVALAFEPGERGVLQRPPRRRSEGIISPLLWERTVITGVVVAVGTLILFRWELDQTDSVEKARTVAVTTMVLFQMFHVGNVRSERLSAFAKSPLSNPFLFIGTSAALAIHIAALYFPWTQYILRVEPLEWEAWARMAAMAVTVIAAVELHKLVRSRM